MSWRSMLMAMAVVEADPEIGVDGDAAVVTDEDAGTIRQLVRAHMASLRSGDATRAFAMSTRGLRDTFGTAERMLQVVRQRQAPLAGARRVHFGEIVITPHGLGQTFQVSGTDGVLHDAIYLVERGLDGAWCVSGSQLVPPRETALAA